MKKNKRKNNLNETPDSLDNRSSSSSSIRNPKSAIRNRIAERFRGLAFVLILACVAGRAFIAEMPFRLSPIQISEITSYMNRGEQPQINLVNSQELARVELAVVLLAAGAIWLLAGAVEGRLGVRHGWLGIVLLGFAGWSFASAWQAVDARSAWTAWLEQVSLLTAGFVMLQVCNSRRRFVLTAAVLAAVGVCLAIKGWMQIGWEQAESARMLKLYGPERLAEMGMHPDDPKTRAYLQRVISTTPTAYFGLANVLAAALTLALAAAAGLTVAKIFYARHRSRTDGPMPAGHIRPATMAMALTALSIVPIAVILVCTRSRGGIGAAAGVLLLTLIGLRFRATLAKHWKRTVAAAVMLLVLGFAGLITFGLTKDRLPGGKTMSIRWFYWTGSAQIVREHPLWGVGAGNFSQAYLKLRRPEAEEAVKTPHNLIAHAATQYGLPGGAMWLVIVGGMIVLAWKPAPNGPILSGGAPAPPDQPICDSRGEAGAPPRNNSISHTRSVFISAGCVVLGVLLCRCAFGITSDNPILLVLEGIVPAVVFALALAAERWFGDRLDDLSDGSIRAIRIALAAGGSAMVLHNFVSFGLWAPGTAGLFWTAVAATAAMGDARERSFRILAVPAAVVGIVAVVAAWIILVSPAAKRLQATQNTVDAMLHYNLRQAIREAETAAQADPLDAYAAMNASHLYRISGLDRQRTNADGVPFTFAWAQEAIRRNDSAGAYRLAAQVAGELKRPEADGYWQATIQRDPADARLRIDYATWLLEQKRKSEAKSQLDQAVQIEKQLRSFNPESFYLFSNNEWMQIDALRRKTGTR